MMFPFVVPERVVPGVDSAPPTMRFVLKSETRFQRLGTSSSQFLGHPFVGLLKLSISIGPNLLNQVTICNIHKLTI